MDEIPKDMERNGTRMLTILIVDDEKLERNGIRFLLKREEIQCRIIEAANGKDALGKLAVNHADILFSDIKMPYMNGLELAEKVREMYPEMEIVIFSGYNDFSYAREALRYGVVDYVLKPVDPEEFHKVFLRVCENIRAREKEEEKQIRQEDYLKKYFFTDYLYTGSSESLEQLKRLLQDDAGVLSRFRRMILVSASNGFFETDEEHFTGNLKETIQREFYYVNLDANESIFLFAEKYADYEALAKEMYSFFSKQYDSDCYFAVSEPILDFSGIREEFRKLEDLLERQFYQPGLHVFAAGSEGEELREETPEDSELMEQISKDISCKDISQLKADFAKLEQKYRKMKQYSEMYVKFVFSGILKELYEQMKNTDEKELSKKVDRIYRSRNIQDVIDIVSRTVDEFEAYIADQGNGFREEIMTVKNYIYHHYSERNLSADRLASLVYLSPGYLSAVFKEETGMTLNRFIRDVRMNKAKELLENTNMKITQIAKELGFSNSSYFCRSFREFFGSTPESCRKGNAPDEETEQNI